MSHLKPCGYGDDFPDSQINKVLNRLKDPLDNFEKLQSHLLHNPGKYIKLNNNEGNLGVDIDGEFCSSGKIFNSNNTINDDNFSFEKFDLISANCGGFGYNGEKTTEFLNNFFDFISNSKLGIFNFQDFPYDETIFEELQKKGYIVIANKSDKSSGDCANYDASGSGKMPTCLVTLIPNISGLEINDIGVVPHHQSTFLDRSSGISKRVSLPAAWSLNYQMDDSVESILEKFSVFSTLIVNVSYNGKTINIGNIYVSPPSNPVERIISIDNSVKAMDSNSLNDYSILSGDLNCYGTDKIMNRKIDKLFDVTNCKSIIGPVKSAVDGILSPINKVFEGKAAYPWIFLRGISGSNQKELQKITTKTSREGFSFLNDLSVPTISKLGMNLTLDGILANNDVKGNTSSQNVSWTDHKILVSEITQNKKSI